MVFTTKERFKKNRRLFYFHHYLKYIKAFGLSNYYVNYPGNDIVVCGASRSGSTLLYNILKKVIVKNIESDSGFYSNEKEYKAKLSCTRACCIRKTHEFSILLIKRIKRGNTIGFFSHRDIRDIVASLIQIGWITDLNEFIASGKLHRIVHTSLLFAKTNNMTVIRYEDLISNKEEVINRILKILKIQLDSESLSSIVKETSLQETLLQVKKSKFSTSMGNRYFDPKTCLHKNHIQDGTTGKWLKYLKPEQVKIINDITRDYLEYFGYSVA